MLLIFTTFPLTSSINNSKTSLTFLEIAKNSTILNWDEFQKLLSSDGGVFDNFGHSVSIEGDTALVGAPGDDNNNGSAYIFKWNGSSWIQNQKLISSKNDMGDVFGSYVLLNGDKAFISAYGNESVYVFEYNGVSWVQHQRLIASDGESGDRFGISISVCGSYLIIGSQLDNSGIGSAYIFKLDGDYWVEQQKLVASDGQYYDQFGFSVSIFDKIAVIGAPAINSAYVFKQVGTTWVQEKKIICPGGVDHDEFGESLYINNNYCFIGAPGEENQTGSVYVYKCDGDWSEWQKLTASDGEIDDYFGCSLSLSGDYITIGAVGDDDKGEYTGSVFIFKNDGKNWNEEKKLTASDGQHYDNFGFSVSINNGLILIGAPIDDDNGMGSGSAYIFLGPTPPNAPIISGPKSGKKGTEYSYIFNADDKNNDDVKYFIDWGDGNKDIIGFFQSGKNVIVKHTWNEKGTFIIKAKAEDIIGLVGPEATLSVTIPRARTIIMPFLYYLQIHSNLYLFLQKLLNMIEQ